MEKSKIIDFLGSARLFNVLSKETLERLAGQAIWKQYAADKIVFYQEDPADQVYLIYSGLVAVEIVSLDGRTVSITSLETGDVFGEMAVLDKGQRSANIRTLQATEMLIFGKAVFEGLISENPDFAFAIIRDLVRRLRDTDQQVEAITLLPLRSRLASLLLDLSRKDGSQIEITQTDLAERLSATREKVNVNLQTLQDLGAVELGRKRISILDKSLLTSVTRQ